MRNADATYRKLKTDLLAKLDSIDRNVETNGLTAQDRNLYKELRGELGKKHETRGAKMAPKI